MEIALERAATSMPISHDYELYGQFVLAKGPCAAPEGWRSATLEGFTLHAHALLPSVEVRDAEDRHLGWLLGHALLPDGPQRSTWRLPDAATTPEALERRLAAFGGRWALIAITPGFRRLYLDPSAALACVYRSDRPLAGSTTTAVHWDTIDTYRARKAQEPELGSDQFHPAGTTSDDDTRRLLPNHHLDLDTWQPHRHWPDQPIARRGERHARELAAIVAARIADNVKSVAAEVAPYVGLTAGRDSRVILACSREVVSKVGFITFEYLDERRAPDWRIAGQLASRFGLSWQLLPQPEPNAAVKQEYLYRTGYCGAAGKSTDFYASCAGLDLSRPLLTGFGGEVGRGFYWELVEPRRRPSAANLLGRMRLPATERSVRAMEQWLSGVPTWLDAYGLLDLMYLELRVGCWAGPHQYGTAPFRYTLTPFSHREAYAAMFAMPVEYRRREGMARDILELSWPELLSVPLTQQGWLATLVSRLRSAP